MHDTTNISFYLFISIVVPFCWRSSFRKNCYANIIRDRQQAKNTSIYMILRKFLFSNCLRVNFIKEIFPLRVLQVHQHTEKKFLVNMYLVLAEFTCSKLLSAFYIIPYWTSLGNIFWKSLFRIIEEVVYNCAPLDWGP